MRLVLPEVDPKRLLGELDALYRDQVRATACELADGADARDRNGEGSGHGPVLFTLEGRRNLCRTGFSLAAGDAVADFEAGRLSAAAGEVAWTCALILDDLLDGAEEREGHPCAHLVYGRARTVTAVGRALIGLAARGLTVSAVPLRSRLAMERFGLRLLSRCIATQTPGRSGVPTIAAYERRARDLNNSMHWSLMAPMLGRGEPPLIDAASLFADATSVNGKMRNDLLDYYGGSTESMSLYGDFEQRLLTLPVLVLLEQDLPPGERLLVEGHFFEGGDALSPSKLIGLLEERGATERCLDLMWSNVDRALDAVARIVAICGAESWLAELTLRWTSYVISYAEARVRAPAEASWQT
jgi:geranylgeranyl pyrophosphate synthase